MKLATEYEEVDENCEEFDDEIDGESDEQDDTSLNLAWLRDKNVSPAAREILSQMYGVPLNGTEKGTKVNVEVKEVQVTDAKEETRKLNPCSADYADEYLRARGYETHEGLRLRNHRGQWFRFDGTYYEPVSDKELRADIMNYFTGTSLRGSVRKSFASEIMNHLEAKCLMPDAVSLPAIVAEGKWEEDPGTITLQNGVINLGTVQLGITPRRHAHNPARVSTTLLPYDYDPKAECPQWLTFLEQVLPDAASRELLQQIFGYCLTRDVSLQKLFMFEGPGANGKSVVTGVLRRLVGTNNTSSLPLSLFDDKHGLVSTYGKLVNFSGELREKNAVAEELLKQATGGDLMYFNPKHQKPFSAPFTAKLIICTNERPAFTDRSNGIWRRLIMLPFTVSIAPEDQDPELEQKLATELSGILNWAIQGAIDLYKSSRFVEPQVSVEAVASFKEQANPERVFLKEYCQLGPDVSIGTQALYDAYRDYTLRKGNKPLSEPKFQKEVLTLPGVTKERPHTTGPRINMYRGITVEGL